MRTVFIIDLDGTLFDNTHRAHLIPEDKGDTAAWVAFNGACAGDTVRIEVATIVSSLLKAGEDVRYLTGRGESSRVATRKSLLLYLGPLRAPLYMRPMDDHRSGAEFKRSVIREMKSQHPECAYLAIEDDPKVAAMFREEGVTVLQIDSRCAAVLSETQNK